MPELVWALGPWTPSDASGLASLRAALELDGEPVGAPFDWHGPRRDELGRQSLTLVANSDDPVLLGAGTLSESPVAPTRWRLALHVHPGHRCQGIGTALLDSLAAEAARRDDRALQVGLSYAATDSIDFFIRRGFRYLMRTRLGTIDPWRIPDSTWFRISEAERWAHCLAIRIRSQATIENLARRTPEIADLHAKIYRQTHAWSPPAPLDPDTAIAIFLGDDLIPEALFVAFDRDRDRPIGVSSLRVGESEMEFDLGWTGVLTEVGSHAPNLTLALLGQSLSFARAAKRTITVEVDAADQILWDLVCALPISYKPDWFNLERQTR